MQTSSWQLLTANRNRSPLSRGRGLRAVILMHMVNALTLKSDEGRS